ncbi:type I restriction endonuclease [Hydrangea phyllody phytoplasma]|uniref:type I restriction endonuclease n=2 Tax=Hydrangea phyllody phytoplasma TaxID=238673 RepID=UPI003CC91A10
MFQVAQNVPAQNSYKNESKSAEYDIVILINGIPLVLIELKKRSLDKGLDKAFKQVEDYELFRFFRHFFISKLLFKT